MAYQSKFQKFSEFILTIPYQTRGLDPAIKYFKTPGIHPIYKNSFKAQNEHFRGARFILWLQDQRDRRARGDDYKQWYEHPDSLPFQHTYGANAEWIGEYQSRPRRVERGTAGPAGHTGSDRQNKILARKENFIFNNFEIFGFSKIPKFSNFQKFD